MRVILSLKDYYNETRYPDINAFVNATVIRFRVRCIQPPAFPTSIHPPTLVHLESGGVLDCDRVSQKG
jgi:hypothetical protein